MPHWPIFRLRGLPFAGLSGWDVAMTTGIDMRWRVHWLSVVQRLWRPIFLAAFGAGAGGAQG